MNTWLYIGIKARFTNNARCNISVGGVVARILLSIALGSMATIVASTVASMVGARCIPRCLAELVIVSPARSRPSCNFFENLPFACSEPKKLELSIKHEKCSYISYKQRKKITQPVSKCKLWKNPTVNDNFSHKTTFFALKFKKCHFQKVFFIVNIDILDE